VSSEGAPPPPGGDEPPPPPGDDKPPVDDPILPATTSDAELAAAVGVKPPPRRSLSDEPLDDDGLPDEKRRNRKVIAVSAIALVGGIGVVVLVLLGRVNAQRYYLRCTTSQAVAEQGRSFPPWGSSPLPGAEWRPIALPANGHRKGEELPDGAGVGAVFLDVLVGRPSATLAGKTLLETPPIVDGKTTIAPLDAVSRQLEQALLLSRAPERGDQRKQVERLQGDVQYWRATLRLREASAALTEATRQFDQAALSRPLHVNDAGAWAGLVRRLTAELHAGPGGTAPIALPGAAAPPDGRTPAPAGTALPVEPDASAGSDVAPASTPDAGVPSGGVLL